MSPEFKEFVSCLNAISEKDVNPVEMVFREDTRRSDKDFTAYVLYLWYEDDQWEYHWFYFPKREAIMAEIEFFEFNRNF